MSAIRWTTLSDVETKPVQWLWEERIPCGKVTLLDGEPGSGKSMLALELAARVSRGATMPLSTAKCRGPANVVIFNDDDNLADTVRPRLEAAGADLTRIHSVEVGVGPADVDELKPALIILDPLSVYLCQDTNRRPREVLKNITHLAKESGAAVLAVQFLPKNGFWGGEIYDAARSVLLVSVIGHGRHRVALKKSILVPGNEVTPLVFHFEETAASVKIAGWADSV